MAHRFLPAGQKGLPTSSVHLGGKSSILLPQALELIGISPNPHGQTGQIGRSKGRSLSNYRAANRFIQNISLKLKQEGVAAGSAVLVESVQ